MLLKPVESFHRALLENYKKVNAELIELREDLFNKCDGDMMFYLQKQYELSERIQEAATQAAFHQKCIDALQIAQDSLYTIRQIANRAS